MPKEFKILGGIALGAIILGFILFKFGGEPVNRQPLTMRDSAYSKGAPNAPITITEFADFQCPACRSARDVANQLLLAYPNDVRIVFRHFPLPGHPHALLAAKVSEAAGAQGKFWEMHDLLYEQQAQWGDVANNRSQDIVTGMFMGYAQQLGLDLDTFARDLDTNSYTEIIDADISAGAAAGVNATPTFFVNDTIISNPSFDAIKKEIERQKSN